jgi:outer membrane murein-binding lipoprotein Lpp
MIRRLLIVASLAGFLFAVSAHAQPAYQNAQSDQQSSKVQTVTGKVTQVETGGKAFSVDVTQGNDKKPMRFVVGKETTVQGHVAAGSMASVDYQPDANGQLVALSVKEQTAQPQ